MAHVALAITLVIGVVFAHGGACAALELSEPAAHGPIAVQHGSHATADGPPTARYGARCLHRQLPPGHQHGTEQDCLAIKPVGPPLSAPASATECGAPAITTAEAASTPTDLRFPLAPHRGDLCVIRI